MRRLRLQHRRRPRFNLNHGTRRRHRGRNRGRNRDRWHSRIGNGKHLGRRRRQRLHRWQFPNRPTFRPLDRTRRLSSRWPTRKQRPRDRKRGRNRLNDRDIPRIDSRPRQHRHRHWLFDRNSHSLRLKSAFIRCPLFPHTTATNPTLNLVTSEDGLRRRLRHRRRICREVAVRHDQRGWQVRNPTVRMRLITNKLPIAVHIVWLMPPLPELPKIVGKKCPTKERHKPSGHSWQHIPDQLAGWLLSERNRRLKRRAAIGTWGGPRKRSRWPCASGRTTARRRDPRRWPLYWSGFPRLWIILHVSLTPLARADRLQRCRGKGRGSRYFYDYSS